jgi:hypothetical protein
MMSSTFFCVSVVVLSSMMPAEENCASTWANHTVGPSDQNGGSRMAILDTSTRCVLFVASILRRGSPMWDHAREVSVKRCHTLNISAAQAECLC